MIILTIIGFFLLLAIGLYLGFVAVVVWLGESMFSGVSALPFLIGAVSATILGVAFYLIPFTISINSTM